MSDTNERERIAEIEKRLAEVSRSDPLPWEHTGEDLQDATYERVADRDGSFVARTVTEESASLIAAAPADLRYLLDRLREVEAERDALREQVAELTTPDILGHDDYTYYAEEGFDADDLYPGHMREVWGNRTLGMFWLARVPTEWDDEGDVAEDEVRLFNTKAEAEAALASARAAAPAAGGANG